MSSTEIKIRKKTAPVAIEKWSPAQIKQFYHEVFLEVAKLAPSRAPYTVGIDVDIYRLLRDKYPGKRTRLRRAIGSYFYHKTRTKYYQDWLSKAKWRWGINGRRVKIDRTDLNKYLKKAA